MSAEQTDQARAVLQLLWMRREACDRTASDDGWKGQDTRYQLGGRQALDELLADVDALMQGATPDKEMLEFFVKT